MYKLGFRVIYDFNHLELRAHNIWRFLLGAVLGGYFTSLFLDFAHTWLSVGIALITAVVISEVFTVLSGFKKSHRRFRHNPRLPQLLNHVRRFLFYSPGCATQDILFWSPVGSFLGMFVVFVYEVTLTGMP